MTCGRSPRAIVSAWEREVRFGEGVSFGRWKVVVLNMNGLALGFRFVAGEELAGERLGFEACHAACFSCHEGGPSRLLNSGCGVKSQSSASCFVDGRKGNLFLSSCGFAMFVEETLK